VGRIALAERGGRLAATCTIGKSISPRADQFAMRFPKHRIKPQEF